MSRKPRSLGLYVMMFACLPAGCSIATEGPLSHVGGVNVGIAYGVAVDGDYAYVTNNDGVAIIDIRTPADRPTPTAYSPAIGATQGRARSVSRLPRPYSMCPTNTGARYARANGLSRGSTR